MSSDSLLLNWFVIRLLLCVFVKFRCTDLRVRKSEESICTPGTQLFELLIGKSKFFR